MTEKRRPNDFWSYSTVYVCLCGDIYNIFNFSQIHMLRFVVVTFFGHVQTDKAHWFCSYSNQCLVILIRSS